MVEIVDSEFSGDEKDLLIAILYGLISPSEFFARVIYKCVEGAGTSDDRMIRAVVTRAEEDMKIIKKYFKQLFNKDMIETVKKDLSGNYSRLIESLMSNN